MSSLLNIVHLSYKFSFFFHRSFYRRKPAKISILPIPSAQLSDDECSSDDENDETDHTEYLLSHDESETDSEEILSDSENSDGDEEINIQPTDSYSTANKELT